MRERGFALLIVLWTLVLLALLGTRIVAAGRYDTRLARNLIDAAVLEAETEGAVQQTIFQMLLPGVGRWTADGTTHVVRVGRAVVTIRLEDESGKVNPNIASEPLLAALLIQVGAPRATANAVAAAIVDWRTAGTEPRPLGAKAPQYAAAGRDYGPPGSDFRDLDELGSVLGMTPVLLARLRPHMTVYSDTDPDGSSSDKIVTAALGETGMVTASGAAGLEVVTIIAEARGLGNAAFGERVVVRLGGAGSGHPFDILALDRRVPEQAP
jgi:general secretion pathway protein K